MTSCASPSPLSFLFREPLRRPPPLLVSPCLDHNLLLRDRALARPLSRARVSLRPLAADRQTPPVPQAPVAADFHQPLDVHRDLFPEVALDAALFLDHPADLAHVVL